MGQLFDLDSSFSRVLFRVVDIFILNFLFILFCLPIITIGASTVALHSVLLKMIKNEEKNIIKSFLLGFKMNFFKSTIIWGIVFILGFVILLDFLFLDNLTGIMKFLFTSMTFIFGLIYFCVSLFIFPYTARYEDTIKRSFLNSLLLGIKHPFSLLALLLVNGLIIMFVLSSDLGFLSGLYFGTFGGIALLSYLNAYLIGRIFAKYEVQTEL